jgi:hypothetical protein
MLIVDAYNVLHITGVLPPEIAGVDLPGLARLVALSRYRITDTLLVCDGPHRHEAADIVPPCHTQFAGPGNDADAIIEALLARTPRSKRAIVISSDARLRRAAGKHHARYLRSEVWLHQLAIDYLAHQRGVGPASRQPLRPDFARELPLDPHTAARWAADMGLPITQTRPCVGQVFNLPASQPPADSSPPPPRTDLPPSRQPANLSPSLSMDQWLELRPFQPDDKPAQDAPPSRRSARSKPPRRRSR